MKNHKTDLRSFGINPAKGRKYEYITYVLALIYNLLQTRTEKYLAVYGLNTVQFNLLMLAAYQNQGRGLSQVELTKRLIVSPSNITKLVEKSVRAGLLTRTVNSKNRRENIICITSRGSALIEQIWPGYDKLVRGLTELIPAEQRSIIEQILNNWLSSLQQEK